MRFDWKYNIVFVYLCSNKRKWCLKKKLIVYNMMVGYLMIFVIYKGMGLLVNICVIKLGKFYLFVCLNYCIFVKGFKLFVDKFNDFFER